MHAPIQLVRCFRCSATLSVDEAQAISDAVSGDEGVDFRRLYDNHLSLAGTTAIPTDGLDPDCRMPSGDVVVCLECVVAHDTATRLLASLDQ